MNSKKRQFKSRLSKIHDIKVFSDYLNDEYRRHEVFKMVVRGRVIIDRVIKKKYSLIVKAHDQKTKHLITLSFSNKGRKSTNNE